MSQNLFQEAVQALVARSEELKAAKKAIRDIENDVPMELEDLMLQLTDLKKQAKERKDEFIRDLLEENADYVEMREKVQTLKEDIANAKLELFTAAANASREKGDLDETLVVEGLPVRLQTQKEVSVYLDGKAVK